MTRDQSRRMTRIRNRRDEDRSDPALIDFGLIRVIRGGFIPRHPRSGFSS
jgi:hypothetical protein